LGPRKLESEIAVLENDNEMVSLLAFHPFETLVIVANENDGLSVWNWKEGVRINRFSNLNPPGSRVTSLSLLNEHDIAGISAGSDDGVVRIWKGVYEQGTAKLVTAWKVLSDLSPVSTLGSAGLIVDWQQQHELLMASGNASVIRIWDVSKELAIQDIPTGSETFVTCMTSDKTEDGRTIVAGFSDGTIRLYDRRVGHKHGPVVTFAEHKNWVINVALHKNTNQIISGSTIGDVKFWTEKSPKSSKTMSPKANNSAVMTALAVHEVAPLLATGSQDQRIKVMNFNAEELSLIRYHEGFLGQRIGPVSCLAFHPYQVLLAAGATDSIVSIYAGESPKK